MDVPNLTDITLEALDLGAQLRGERVSLPGVGAQGEAGHAAA